MCVPQKKGKHNAKLMIDTFWKIKKNSSGPSPLILFMIAIVFIMSCPPIPTQEVYSNMFQQNKKVSKTQK